MAAVEQAAEMKPDLIILPETAIPELVVLSRPDTGLIAQKMATNGIPLLVGMVEAVPGVKEHAYYNSSVLYGVDGKVIDVYRKRHLVPFGEYVPLGNLFPFLNRCAPLGFSCKAGKQSTVFRLHKKKAAFSSLICFEDAFPWVARAAVKSGARLLINQTNDAWFDGSCASVQHMSQCVFRCIENRVGAVRAANSGVTCFIDSMGVIDGFTSRALSESAVMEPEEQCRMDSVLVRPEDMKPTFYTRYGDAAFAMPCGLLAMAGFLLVLAVERRKHRRLNCEA
jgi:apolipoprotein N-acyltransferase